LQKKEVYKFIKDIIENAQNILLIIDSEKPELPEIINTYTDTWGKMVQVLILRKFTCGDVSIYTQDPEFENMEITQMALFSPTNETDIKVYSEEYHLDGVDETIKTAYLGLKHEALRFSPKARFNPQKYYISIVLNKNKAFFKIKRKKIRLVVMLSFDVVQPLINKHPVRRLSEGVQRFYNGPCCEITISSEKDVEEVVGVFEKLLI